MMMCMKITTHQFLCIKKHVLSWSVYKIITFITREDVQSVGKSLVMNVQSVVNVSNS